jgi:hypothetical protein
MIPCGANVAESLPDFLRRDIKPTSISSEIDKICPLVNGACIKEECLAYKKGSKYVVTARAAYTSESQLMTVYTCVAMNIDLEIIP